MIDYHTHTKLCKHANGEPYDYIKKAIEKGLSEIGLSDHMPMPDGFDPRHRMEISEFEIYKEWYRKALEEFSGKISIKFGIEAEFVEKRISFIENFIHNENFDYVIGSIHFIDDWNIASDSESWRWEREDVNTVYEKYYITMKKLVTSGLFDIVGHFDMIKKYGYGPTRDFEDMIREVLRLVKENGLCVEINTSGLRKKASEVYPSEKILEMIRELKIPLTLGSDAHKPEDVGRDLEIALALVERYGYGRISIFEKRERKEMRVEKFK